MKDGKLEVTRGTGNVFRDLGHENADAEQFKAILAAEIIKALDREGLSVRAAHDRTGIAAADFSRIRNADLGRFTVDRLMSIINRLGSRIEVKIRVRRAEAATHGRGRSELSAVARTGDFPQLGAFDVRRYSCATTRKRGQLPLPFGY
jgi:predicted XRE-type DNA-binding protein